MADIVLDKDKLEHISQLVEYWPDPYGSDASHWSDERIPGRLAPSEEDIQALPGAQQIPDELRSAIGELMQFPLIYTRRQRSTT